MLRYLELLIVRPASSQEVTQSRVVDIMEVVMALLFTSRMPMEDKINFLFDCMDFDGRDARHDKCCQI